MASRWRSPLSIALTGDSASSCVTSITSVSDDVTHSVLTPLSIGYSIGHQVWRDTPIVYKGKDKKIIDWRITLVAQWQSILYNSSHMSFQVALYGHKIWPFLNVNDVIPSRASIAQSIEWMVSRPTNACFQMSGRDQSGCHAGHQGVSRCCSGGES